MVIYNRVRDIVRVINDIIRELVFFLPNYNVLTH